MAARFPEDRAVPKPGDGGASGHMGLTRQGRFPGFRGLPSHAARVAEHPAPITGGRRYSRNRMSS